MQDIIDSIRNALLQENWYAALFVSLTLPDICVALEHGKTSGKKYSQWFETNLIQYRGFLSGDDCYALRCSLLHQGKGDISNQKMKDILEHYIFLTSGSHCNLFKDIVINGGPKESFLQLNVARFCTEMCDAVSQWIVSMQNNKNITNRVNESIVIREPGYVYKGVIKFG